MNNQKALGIIHNALTSYIEDSSGVGTLETQDIENAYQHIKGKLIKTKIIPYAQSGIISNEMLDKAMDYVSMEYEDLERVLNEVSKNSEIKDSESMDFCHDDFQILEKFEHTFTVGSFFEHIS